MKHCLLMIATFACALLSAASNLACADGEKNSVASGDSPQSLVRELGSDDYAARESAMRDLLQADATAIPLLVNATQAGDLEVTWRVLSTLRRMAFSGDDLDKQDLAVVALEELCLSDNPVVAAESRLFVRGSYTRHQRAVIRLRELGATVSHGDGRPTHVALGSHWQGGRHSLVHLNRLDDLQELSLELAPINDAQLVDLGSLRYLKKLYLGGTQIRGDGLIHLAELEQLQFVSLRSQQLTPGMLKNFVGAKHIEQLGLDETNAADADLAHLQGLANLQTLWLNQTQITDAGLAHLTKLSKLSKLILTGTQVCGAGLASLKEITSLRYLSLQGVRLDDDNSQYLAELNQVETLGLDDTQIGDEGLAKIKDLAGLKILWLTNTRVSDAGIEHLAQMKRLQQVYIRGTRITDMGIARLKKVLPACEVFE